MENYIHEQMEIIQINSKTKNILYNAINKEEYEKISSYEIAKEIMDKLEITYARTDKVKKTIMSLIVYEFKLFKVKEWELIKSMLANSNRILGEFKAAGKNYFVSDQITQILMSPLIMTCKSDCNWNHEYQWTHLQQAKRKLILFKSIHLNECGQETLKKSIYF